MKNFKILLIFLLILSTSVILYGKTFYGYCYCYTYWGGFYPDGADVHLGFATTYTDEDGYYEFNGPLTTGYYNLWAQYRDDYNLWRGYANDKYFDGEPVRVDIDLYYASEKDILQNKPNKVKFTIRSKEKKQ